jgi:hypothetical protein
MTALGSRLDPACLISSYKLRASVICPCEARAETSTLLISFKCLIGNSLSRSTYHIELDMLNNHRQHTLFES